MAGASEGNVSSELLADMLGKEIKKAVSHAEQKVSFFVFPFATPSFFPVDCMRNFFHQQIEIKSLPMNFKNKIQKFWAEF